MSEDNKAVEQKKVNQSDWSPVTWKDYPIKQLPEYPDQDALNEAFEELRSYPPLLTSWEILKLKERLASAAAGDAFVLQGGDCAEKFTDCNSPKIVNLLKVMLQMSFILIHEMGLPVVRIGRIAGQFAKPRSSPFEKVNGEKIPSYRGDLINSIEAELEARQPNPQRLLEGYQKSAMTINFIRALIDEGFADLHHPEYWELDFMRNNKYYEEYEEMVNSIHRAVSFVETISPQKLPTLHNINMYTSHEALNLYYESAQTRQVPRHEGWFNLNAHMVWLGNRTRDIDGAHVEYLRGIQNPIGIKVGPPLDVDETLRLIEKLNPNHEAGKIVLITRFGQDRVSDELPEVIRKVRRTGLPVVWSCDPMHGNTFSTDDDFKTRNFDDVLSEIKQTFAIHRSEGTHLGGVHLEMTGDNVTECVGGAQGLAAEGLHHNYETFCDPRLNYEQSLEMAFLIAKEWTTNGHGK